MRTARKRRRALGVISPHLRYMASALTRRGLGPERQAEMRASGLVKPIDIGNARWYRGNEVIAWIDSLGK
jgi:hypothetical protein